MRKLTRPEPPEWFDDFREAGFQEFSKMVEEAGGDGITESYLRGIRLYRSRKEHEQLRKIFSNAAHRCCHMCEAREEGGVTYLELEHYRPKQFASNDL